MLLILSGYIISFSFGRRPRNKNSLQAPIILFPFGQLLTIKLLKTDPSESLTRLQSGKQWVFLAALKGHRGTASERVQKTLPSQIRGSSQSCTGRRGSFLCGCTCEAPNLTTAKPRSQDTEKDRQAGNGGPLERKDP